MLSFTRKSSYDITGLKPFKATYLTLYRIKYNLDNIIIAGLKIHLSAVVTAA